MKNKTIFFAVLFGGAVAIGFGVAYGTPCPDDWTGELRDKWLGVQIQSFCMYSTAWALFVRAADMRIKSTRRDEFPKEEKEKTK